MTIKELKDKISHLDDNLEVYIARDEEGNGFSSLYSVETEHIYNDDYDIEVIHEDNLEDYGDDHVKEGIVLWP